MFKGFFKSMKTNIIVKEFYSTIAMDIDTLIISENKKS